jgi:hypothetical protein
VVEWLTLLLRIREVPGSNLDPETGYPDLGFSCFFSVSPGKCRDSIGHNHSFHIISNSLFTYSRVQRFWPLKCANCNLRARHQKFVGSDWGRGGRGRKETNLIALSLFLPSFSGRHAGLCKQGQRPKPMGLLFDAIAYSMSH